MMKATDLLVKAIEIVKQDGFYSTVDCQFQIVKEGLLPFSNRNNKCIFVPISIVPFLQMYNLKGYDILSSYILGHRLIESDFYEEAEEILINLRKYSYTDLEANNLEKHYNRIITQVVFILFHELGHFAFEFELLKEVILPDLNSRYLRWVEQLKNSHDEFIRVFNKQANYYDSKYHTTENKNNKSYIESYVSDYLTHLNSIDFEKIFQLNKEEYFADSYAFFSMVNTIELFNDMNGSYFSIIEYSVKALECSYLFSAADGYLNNEYPVDDRFKDNSKSINLTGNSIPRDFRIPNIMLLLSDTNSFEQYKEQLYELSDDFYLKLPEFILKFNVWGHSETEKLYEGNFCKSNSEKRNQLYSEYMLVNSLLCKPFKIEFE